MTIVNATWEKRNLGVTCTEVMIEPNDTVADLGRLNSLDTQYQVVKCPPAKIDVMFHLESLGFNFIETISTVITDLSIADSLLTGITGRMIKDAAYSEMDDSDFDELHTQIRAGIFQTDRVYLDPAFTNEQAANRYIGWIKDDIDRGARVYKGIINGRAFGFFNMYKDEDNIAHAPIVGVYKGYDNTGLGMVLYYFMMKNALHLGCKKMAGAVSNNNMRSLKSSIAIGSKITDSHYVYVKHTA